MLSGRRLRMMLFMMPLLAVSYFVSGMLSLILESPQAGVTPIWLPSGVAFLFFWRFGIGVWPGLLLGMLLIAGSVGMPYPVAAIAAAGSILEAAIPVLILSRLRFDPRLLRVSDVMYFVALAVLLGPIFSAGLGTLAMWLLLPIPGLEIGRTILLWWLGNSIGMLVVGSFLLVWQRRPEIKFNIRRLLEFSGLILLSSLLSFLSIRSSAGAASILLLYLLVPVVAVAGVRYIQHGVSVATTSAMISVLASTHMLSPNFFNISTAGGIFQNIALLWLISFIGLLVAAAFNEHRYADSLRFHASHDDLTQLVNRREFRVRLERALQASQQRGLDHQLLFIDLDKLKQVNDLAGHAAGDQLLRDSAAVFRTQVRLRDTVARLSGDEFAILLSDCDQVMGLSIAEAIRIQIEQQGFEWQTRTFSPSVSIGIASIAGHGTVEQILGAADRACYRSKHAGGNSVSVADDEFEAGPGSRGVTEPLV